jgi:CheY-like chemotaxis protein
LRFSGLPAKIIGNVLLVEDDSAVRQVTRMFLEGTGLTVLEATCSEDAIQIAASAGDTLRLLITDLMLPGKDGLTLATDLLARFPQLKVILISGYTEHGLPDPTSLKEATFLSKPFSRHELIERVASLLREAGDGALEKQSKASRDSN